MHIYRLLILFLAMLLSGCTESTEDFKKLNKLVEEQTYNIGVLQYRNKIQAERIEELESDIRKNFYGKLLERKNLEKEAAIAHACRYPFNFNVCPNSMVKAGDDAIKQGISGGSDYIFWSLVFLKIFTPLLAICIPLVFFFYIKNKYLNGIYIRIEDANAVLDKASSNKNKIENEIDKLIKSIASNELAGKKANKDLSELGESIKLNNIKLMEENNSLKRMNDDLKQQARMQKEMIMNEELFKDL